MDPFLQINGDDIMPTGLSIHLNMYTGSPETQMDALLNEGKDGHGVE